jgi:DNA polymerase
MQACKAWLEAEIRAVKPRVILCLGRTAAQSFAGKRFNLTRYRGRAFRSPWAEVWLASWHPAAILRMPDHVASAQAFEELVSDLKAAQAALTNGSQTELAPLGT